MPETCAHGLAQSSVVSATPTSGRKARSFLTTLGKHSLASTPSSVGTRTTWNVDSARPAASTGTSVPASTLVSSGVITIAPSVDAVVISTESATSPLAM